MQNVKIHRFMVQIKISVVQVFEQLIHLQYLKYFYIFNPMQSQEPNNHKQALIKELLEFGFDELYVLRAVELTLDKEKAAEILLKLVEEGPNADLSAYQVPSQEAQQKPKAEQEGKEDAEKEAEKPNRAKLILVVNGSLKMGKGKICAQVGHAVLGAYLNIEEKSRFEEKSRLRLHSWESSGGAKIVVRANNLAEMKKAEKEIKALDDSIITHIVADAGHTQIEAGSETVMAIGPAFSNQIDIITNRFKLL